MYTTRNKQAGLAPVVAVLILLAVSVGSYIAVEKVYSDKASYPSSGPMTSELPPNSDLSWWGKLMLKSDPRPSSQPPQTTPTPTPAPRPTPEPAPVPVGTGIYGKVITEIVMGPTGRKVPFTGEVIAKNYVTKEEVKRFTPAADGSFDLSLSVGSYYMVPATGFALWAERYPKVIEVKANSYTYAEVFFASAMQ